AAVSPEPGDNVRLPLHRRGDDQHLESEGTELSGDQVVDPSFVARRIARIDSNQFLKQRGSWIERAVRLGARRCDQTEANHEGHKSGSFHRVYRATKSQGRPKGRHYFIATILTSAVRDVTVRMAMLGSSLKRRGPAAPGFTTRRPSGSRKINALCVWP